MSFAEVHDGGADCRLARVSGNNTALAAGTGDNTEVNGAWIDRLSAKGMAMSAKLGINYTASLAATETLTFALNFQDAVDAAGTGAADYPVGEVVAATVAATGDSGSATQTGVVEQDVDLGGARRFIRAQITPNLSRGATDTAAWSSMMVLFGDQRGLVTNSPTNMGGADLI